MVKRLIRWFSFNFLFALIPFLAACLIRCLAGNFCLKSMSDSPEILFFSIMVCATALGDLQDTIQPTLLDNTLKLFSSCLLIGAVFSSILYGTFLYAEILGAINEMYRYRLFVLSIYSSVILFLLSTTIEIIISRINEGNND